MRARDSRVRGGYSLFELMVVVMIMTVVLGAVAATVVASKSRVRGAWLAAEERFDALRISELMARDVRAARSAAAVGGLTLAHSESRTVVWLVRGERLVRVADGREQVFRTPVSAMRVGIEDSFVEVGVKLKRSKRSRGGALYVAARTRLAPKEQTSGAVR